MKNTSSKNKRLLMLLLLSTFMLTAAFFAVANSTVKAQAQSQPNVLEHNWVMDSDQNWVSSVGINDIEGHWKSNWGDYNCYAYAIGRTDNFHYPGVFSNPKIVLPSGEYSQYTIAHPIAEIAGYVKSDLDTLGEYGDVYVTDYDPDIVEPYQTKICVRATTTNTADFWQEFHFMKHVSDAWYHKPGGTAILKYKYQDPGAQDWIFECAYPDINNICTSYNFEDMVVKQPDIYPNTIPLLI